MAAEFQAIVWYSYNRIFDDDWWKCSLISTIKDGDDSPKQAFDDLK